jgi:hypothetical protein
MRHAPASSMKRALPPPEAAMMAAAACAFSDSARVSRMTTGMSIDTSTRRPQAMFL